MPDGWTDIEGSTRGPRGPKKKTTQISLAWDTEHNDLILLFLHRYPNVGHEVTMEMKHDLSIFLKKTLG